MRVGLAVIIGAEVKLIDRFIAENQIADLFTEVNFLCDKSEDGTIEKLQTYEEQGVCQVYQRDLNLDFAAQRNYLNSLMKSEYILRLDVDEFMNQAFKFWLQSFTSNKDRYVIRRTERVDHKILAYTPITVVYKNSPTIYWTREIHECIIGHKNELKLASKYTIVHDKTTPRCAKQNKFYYDNFEEQRKIVDAINKREKTNGLK